MVSEVGILYGVPTSKLKLKLTYGLICGILYKFAEVMELADMQDLGSCAARRVGSSPIFCINTRGHTLWVWPLVFMQKMRGPICSEIIDGLRLSAL